MADEHTISTTDRSPLRLLSRLALDTRGNTLAMVAASIAPILAMVGGGVDMGRSYMSENRLQQACDAGVLAARKKLGSQAIVDGEVPDDVAAAGERFFNVNFRTDSYGTQNRDFEMTLEDDYSISGVATVDVPTTVMSIFGFTNVPVKVGCAARLSFSNTDVMMVLDTTGSMLQTNPGDALPKIAILRNVILGFYAQLEAAKSGGTRVRYGFVPYSANVNVGYLLKSDWMVDEWDYQSREPLPVPALASVAARRWRYDQLRRDVSGIKGASGDDRIVGGAITARFGGIARAPLSRAAPFNGCIEERSTYEITDYDNVDLDRALDLDIDRVPDASDPDTQWRPQFPLQMYNRAITWNGRGAFQGTPAVTTAEYVAPGRAGLAACPAPARQLAPLSLASITAIVNSLVARGSTYHDIGMIWGGRLLSATGPFADENADVSPSNPTTRNMIFLTDGETAPYDLNYSSYGIEPIDKRRWSAASPLTLRETVEARFAFACKEVKKKNITVWLIAFGVEMNPVMADCAGPGHAFSAGNAAELDNAFARIAQNIGDLRISR